MLTLFKKLSEGKKMAERNRLILWGWFSLEIVKNKLIPDMEKNILQYGVSLNSLYFHHSYAESDIPIGQNYTKIVLMDNYKILQNSIQTCHSEVICFFTCNPKMQPSEHAMRGHHELSLIQFKQGIPRMIYNELFEITELPFSPAEKQICLY